MHLPFFYFHKMYIYWNAFSMSKCQLFWNLFIVPFIFYSRMPSRASKWFPSLRFTHTKKKTWTTHFLCCISKRYLFVKCFFSKFFSHIYLNVCMFFVCTYIHWLGITISVKWMWHLTAVTAATDARAASKQRIVGNFAPSRLHALHIFYCCCCCFWCPMTMMNFFFGIFAEIAL